VVSSKWLYKIKHVADGNIEKHKASLYLMGFVKRKALTMKICLILYTDTLLSEPL
jgi:hypothetical protein